MALAGAEVAIIERGVVQPPGSARADIRADESRLLVIDSAPHIHTLLVSRLRPDGVEVHELRGGDRAVDVVSRMGPDVILLELERPDDQGGVSDGFEVLAALKAEERTRDVPVLLITSRTATDVKVRAFELGAVDFIVKPFDVAELRARVRSAVRHSRFVRMLAQRAQVDGLTGLWNRAYLDERLGRELATAVRYREPLAFMMVDLDHFKRLNDDAGHPFGDAVLQRVAALLGEGRAGDIACRYGGEEFGLILPRTSAEEAGAVADRLRLAIRSLRWPGHQWSRVTASFGVTDLHRCGDATLSAFLASSDQALYAAKRAGRDRVAVARAPSLV